MTHDQILAAVLWAVAGLWLGARLRQSRQVDADLRRRLDAHDERLQALETPKETP